MNSSRAGHGAVSVSVYLIVYPAVAKGQQALHLKLFCVDHEADQFWCVLVMTRSVWTRLRSGPDIEMNNKLNNTSNLSRFLSQSDKEKQPLPVMEHLQDLEQVCNLSSIYLCFYLLGRSK